MRGPGSGLCAGNRPPVMGPPELTGCGLIC
jgi:hypothetical protein